MTKTLHSIAHWFHQQPVAHIAWTCTALAVVLTVLIILPNAFRRLRTSGNRAPSRIVVLVVLTGLGLATLAEIDHGYRVHIGTAEASFTQTQYAQPLTASGPFPISTYDALHMALFRDSSAAGSLPELRRAGNWNDLRSRTPFSATVVALPVDLSPTFYPSRPLPSHFQAAVDRWQAALAHLGTGLVYVNRAAVTTFRILKKDTLATSIAGRTQYLTITGVFPNSNLLGGQPLLITTLDAAQRLYGVTNQVSRALIFYTARQGTDATKDRQSILSRASSVPGASLPAAVATYSIVVAGGQAPDWTRRLAFGALVLIVLISLLLLIHGRDSVTGNASGSRKSA